MSVWFGDLQWYLFGSHATGEADEHSDIDIMVEGVAPENLDMPYWRDMTTQLEAAGLDTWLHHEGKLFPVTGRERATAKDATAVRYALHHRRFLGDETSCLLKLKRSLPEPRACTNQNDFIARGLAKHRRLTLRLEEFRQSADSKAYAERHVMSDKLFVIYRSPSGMFQAVTINQLMNNKGLVKQAKYEKQAVWRERLNLADLQAGKAPDAGERDLQTIPYSVVSWADENNPLQSIKAGWPRIVCAAMRTKEGWIIPSPRHCDKTFHALTSLMGLKKPVQGERGFIDQYGTFYTRADAWFLHVDLSELPYEPRGGPKGELYSEHLY